MTALPGSTSEVSPLGVLGFTDREERLYRLLLRQSGHTITELSALAGMPTSELRAQVTRFAGLGVLELHDEVVVPRSPEVALGRLLSEEVRRVRSRGEQLDA